MDDERQVQGEFLEEIEVLRGRIAELEEVLSGLRKKEVEVYDEKGVYEGLFEQDSYLAQMLGPDGRFAYVNRLWQETLRYSDDDVREMTFIDILAPGEVEAWQAVLQRLVTEEESQTVRLALQTKDGREVRVRGRVSPVIRRGDLIRINAVFEDLAVLEKVELERDRFFHLSLDMLCVIGFDGYFKRINPAFERILGYSAEELAEKPLLDIVYEDDRKGTGEEMQRLAAGAPSGHFENRYRCKDGSYKWLAWTSFPVVTDGVCYAVARDVTQKKQLEEELRRLSFTDELTALYNRRGFMTFTSKLWEIAQRSDKGLLVTVVDIDCMKGINDRFGHQEGDRAIIKTAEILRMVFRGSDVVARIGGDEFAVSAMVGDQDSAGMIRRRLDELLVSHNTEAGVPYPLSLSLGLAYWNPKSEFSINELVASADAFLYEDKKRHRAMRSQP
ncbi:MAG: diguanylate cyclase [Candidatus Omnitrophota bacterium]|nr:diguanylate cyclase [Candidatus Omnitrophota bacterium]